LKLGLEKQLLMGVGRTALQLGLLGLVLKQIFAINIGWVVLAMLSVMGTIASFTALRQQKIRIPALLPYIAVALLLGAGTILALLTQGVLQVDPWYNPYYLIPFGGMLIGNGMHTLALGLDRLSGELTTRREQVETALALGADPAQAAAPAMRAAIRAATLPLVLELSSVGLVQIPGTMIGQLLGGVDPAIAVKYQMLVMYAWVSTGLLASLIGTRLALKEYFTPEWSYGEWIAQRKP
jgi:putative ABC transport system permease protein